MTDGQKYVFHSITFGVKVIIGASPFGAVYGVYILSVNSFNHKAMNE
jgi:hypothetical protein